LAGPAFTAHGVGSTKDRQPEVSSCSNHHDNVGVWQSGITLTTSLVENFALHELGMPWRAHPLRHPDDSGRSGHDRRNASRDRSWPFGLDLPSNYSVVGVVVVPWWQGAIIIAGSLVVVTALETATDVV